MTRTLHVLAPQAVLPGSSKPQPATITVDLDRGVFVEVAEGVQAVQEGAEVLRLDPSHVLLPGLIDTHVHLNQPGRTEWEGFATGTLAAASGGVTTLIDMPLNSIPPTTTIPNLETKRSAARETGVYTDVGFWGGIIPGNAGDLKGLLDQGAKGFKCFLIESGVDEFPCVDEQDLIKACDALEGTSALILFHAELGSTADHPHSDPTNYSTFLDSRPESLETDALALILRLARRYPSLRFHIVHLSASSALPLIRRARSEDGVSNLTVETCFHYLSLSAADIPTNATAFKCCPPIRDDGNRQKLIDAVVDGTIDFVVSDHSPCIPELKAGDFMSAWGGVSGLGLGLSLLTTTIGDRVGLPRITELLGSRQAKQVGLQGKKGELKKGLDADFVVFDPTETRTVSLDDLRFKNKVSPYLGRELRGWVKQTYLRGQLIWDGQSPSSSPLGTLL
ncbi:putative allantoinase [Papiliotrema laurentii]|uniref:allantoinase n=1 Tax=Papiliotrema laurentii TaxID=5418 RepID=A0AAD9L7T3_PAPLA|nr:putative allantoinase [Papiliotrema laurentii]